MRVLLLLALLGQAAPVEVTDGRVPVVPAPEGRVPDGRYALRVVIATRADFPVIGTQETLMETHALADVKGNVALVRHCAMSATAPLYTTLVAPSTIAAIPVRRAALTRDGDAVTLDLGTLYLGRTANDSGVDTDGDGSPGARMDLDLHALGAWPLQVASASHLVLRGTATATGATGLTDVRLATERIVSGLPVAVDLQARTVDNARSVFALTRVSNDATCQQVPAPTAKP